MRSLAPEVLKARLDVVLSYLGSEADAMAAYGRWIAVEDFDVEADADRLLLAAISEVLPRDDASVALVYVAFTFRKSLTEARDGLG